MSDSVLDDVLVIDFTQVFMGPSCTQLLGDFGADVIKIERPQVGDITRSAVPDRDGQDNPLFQSVNRNKRSLAVDLRTAAGRDATLALAREADVVVNNFRPGVLERLGLGESDFRAVRPDLIWAAGTGYGPAGPYVTKGGQDALAQAYSGVMARAAQSASQAAVYPTAICDYAAGMHLFQGVLLALRHRDRTGEGQRVEVSLFDSMLHLQMQEAAMRLNRGYEVNWGMMPFTGVFATKDGALCLVGGFHPDPIAALSSCLEMGDDFRKREEFATLAGQFEHRVEIQSLLADRLVARTTAEWITLLERHDLLCAPVWDLSTTLDDPQPQLNQMIVTGDHPVSGTVRMVGNPIHLSATPAEPYRLPAPLLGQHTSEILGEGLPGENVEHARADGGSAAGGLG